MIQHIFWDFDGTLFDTYPIMAQAFCETLAAEHGIHENAAQVEATMRISMGHAFQLYMKKHNLSSIETFDARREPLEAQFAKPYPAVPALLAEIHVRGIRQYVYTHRGLSTYTLLQKFGLESFFTDIITSADGFAAKPNPQALHHLLDKHHICREAALMIGDREIDVQAARNAGLRALLFTEDAEAPSGAAARFADFSMVLPCVDRLSAL